MQMEARCLSTSRLPDSWPMFTNVHPQICTRIMFKIWLPTNIRAFVTPGCTTHTVLRMTKRLYTRVKACHRSCSNSMRYTLAPRLMMHSLSVSDKTKQPLWGDAACFGLLRDNILTGMMSREDLSMYEKLDAMYAAYEKIPSTEKWIASKE